MANEAARIPGVCWVCGCTETRPCVDGAMGEPCVWANDNRTICSSCADQAIDICCWTAERLPPTLPQEIPAQFARLAGLAAELYTKPDIIYATPAPGAPVMAESSHLSGVPQRDLGRLEAGRLIEGGAR